MDSLAAYSSSDEETDPAPEKTAHSSAKTQQNPPPPPELAALVLYLENYSMNKNKLLSAFVLLPWLPDAKTVSSLQKTCDLVVQKIRTEMPHTDPRYSWHYTGSNKPVVFGRYGYTNVGAINSLHVSLFPNFFVDPARFDLLHANLARSVTSCAPPANLLVEKQQSALDKMLKENKARKAVSLRLNSQLRCYMLSKSGLIFVAVDINDVAENGGQFLPEYLYLRSLSKVAEEQAQNFECKYDWTALVPNTTRLDDGLPFFRYHVTVLLGEVHMFKHKMSSKHFRQLRKIVEEFDVAETLGGVAVEVDTVRLRNIAGKSYDIRLVD